ncbi:hypothetical protein AGLY_008949 [Aphis glycines]|uniref:Uncharacterized protein n=1 Tax=Aphis glycines TaxID=307491 RepID=A0A6G0TJB5_APHGL|nr:hypothetical protein AGLY_008949 [Aphis glycines]
MSKYCILKIDQICIMCVKLALKQFSAVISSPYRLPIADPCCTLCHSIWGIFNNNHVGRRWRKKCNKQLSGTSLGSDSTYLHYLKPHSDYTWSIFGADGYLPCRRIGILVLLFVTSTVPEDCRLSLIALIIMIIILRLECINKTKRDGGSRNLKISHYKSTRNTLNCCKGCSPAQVSNDKIDKLIKKGEIKSLYFYFINVYVFTKSIYIFTMRYFKYF